MVLYAGTMIFFSPLAPLPKEKQNHTVLPLMLPGLWYHPSKDVKMKRGKSSHTDDLCARTMFLTRMAMKLIRKETRKTPMP